MRVNEEEELDCVIYVDAQSLRDVAEAISTIPQAEERLLAKNSDRSWTSRDKTCVVDIVPNSDFDQEARYNYPDGFLYFRYRVEQYVSESALGSEDMVKQTGDILAALWSTGIPAIASCDYESRLPNGGGFRSDRVPWPHKR